MFPMASNSDTTDVADDQQFLCHRCSRWPATLIPPMLPIANNSDTTGDSDSGNVDKTSKLDDADVGAVLKINVHCTPLLQLFSTKL